MTNLDFPWGTCTRLNPVTTRRIISIDKNNNTQDFYVVWQWICHIHRRTTTKILFHLKFELQLNAKKKDRRQNYRVNFFSLSHSLFLSFFACMYVCWVSVCDLLWTADQWVIKVLSFSTTSVYSCFLSQLFTKSGQPLQQNFSWFKFPLDQLIRHQFNNLHLFYKLVVLNHLSGYFNLTALIKVKQCLNLTLGNALINISEGLSLVSILSTLPHHLIFCPTQNEVLFQCASIFRETLDSWTNVVYFGCHNGLPLALVYSKLRSYPFQPQFLFHCLCHIYILCFYCW